VHLFAGIASGHRRAGAKSPCIVANAFATALNYRLSSEKPLANCAGSEMFAAAECRLRPIEKNLINFAGWADF
jgi:hypothetical protein